MIEVTQSAPLDLPAPDAQSAAHSLRLQTTIRRAIDAAGGAISFARFMDLALYAAGLGYYTAGAHKFGAGGDFVTAPEITDVFSRCVARQCSQILEQLPGGDVLEFGAGTGAMAAGVLRELAGLAALPERYRILEVSPELQERQRATLEQLVPELAERVEWPDALPQSFTGVVLANEVLDAMPVHRFCIEDGATWELKVVWRDDAFAWCRESPGPELAERIAAVTRGLGATLPRGYESEINLALPAWVRSVADAVEQGVLLLMDYGGVRREYYHPQRSRGTLACHYRHRRHADPLKFPGLQDITADVDFTSVAEAADAAGLHVAGYTTQAQFLLASGLDEIVTASHPQKPRRHMELTSRLRTLLLPGEMGERIKVMALTRGINGPLRGFTLRDLRGRL